MDANELGDIAAQVGAAVARELANAERKKTERSADERAAIALRAVKEAYQDNRAQALNAAVGTVGAYCHNARREVLRALKNDSRMPKTINYRQRYAALLKMDDTEEVLKRIGQTLDLAEKILGDDDAVAVGEAVADAADAYAGRVEALDGIAIAAPDNQVRDSTKEPLRIANDADEHDRRGEAAIESAFIDALGEGFDLEGGEGAKNKAAADHLVDAVINVDAAIEAAAHAAEAAAREAARSVTGSALHVPGAPVFTEPAASEDGDDIEAVRKLAQQVRISFATFQRVERDNGLFAVFARDSGASAGKTVRFRPWFIDEPYDEDDDRAGGDAPDIPDVLEEDEDGDTIERSIARMQEYNAKRYWGMLDDDFSDHVDAFWYGFKKLMQKVNGLHVVDLSTFNRYCNEVADSAKEAVADMGAASMDAHQLEEFDKAVRACKKKTNGEDARR